MAEECAARVILKAGLLPHEVPPGMRSKAISFYDKAVARGMDPRMAEDMLVLSVQKGLEVAASGLRFSRKADLHQALLRAMLPEAPSPPPTPAQRQKRVHVATPLEREIKDVLGKGCTICGESSAKLLCVCKTTRYCDVQCQRVDWSQRGHRSVCRKIRERAEAAARHDEVQREEALRDEPLYGPAPRSYADDVRDRIRAQHEAARARREAEPEPKPMSARFGSRCPICLDGWDVSASPESLRPCCCSMICYTCSEKLEGEPCPICQASYQVMSNKQKGTANSAKGLLSLQRHADDGVVEAMVALSGAYYTELPLGPVRSGKRALQLLEDAANLGDPVACLNLASLLHDGPSGVKINKRKARRRALQLFDRVEKLGRADTHYLLGKHGGLFSTDYKVKHFRLAADKGHAKAALCVGHFLETGLYADRDLEEARRLYSSAAGKGLAVAQTCVDRLDRGEPLGLNDTLDPEAASIFIAYVNG